MGFLFACHVVELHKMRLCNYMREQVKCWGFGMHSYSSRFNVLFSHPEIEQVSVNGWLIYEDGKII